MNETLKILRNQFNFTHRMTQSKGRRVVDTGASTIRPLLKNFRGHVNSYIIFDAYIEDYNQSMRQERERREKSKPQKKQGQQ